jgi:hypothetical protein
MSLNQRFKTLNNRSFSSTISRFIATVALLFMVFGLGAYLQRSGGIFQPVGLAVGPAPGAVLGATTQTTSDSAGGKQSTSKKPLSLPTSLIPGTPAKRVLLGFSASDTLRPTYDEAIKMTGPVYMRRLYSKWYSAKALNKMLDKCDSRKQYCVVSFKVPGNNWKGVAAGEYNKDLDDLIKTALARPRSFALAVHHEPQGDGPAKDWEAMQEYLVQYLAPAHAKLTFTTIANGWWWNPHYGKDAAYIATYYSPSLIAKMNKYGGIMAADFYDAQTDVNGQYKGKADRLSVKLKAYTEWARAKGVHSIGAGEFGASTGSELTAGWNVMYKNADLWRYASYFNSLANSDFDWRLVPTGYPAYNASVSIDRGGTLNMGSRLQAFKAALKQSVQ